MITFFSWKFFLNFAFFLNLVAAGVSSSVIKNLNLQYFYFDGDAPNVQDTIKNNFYQLLMIQPIGLFSCKFFPNLCVKNDMSVSLGVKGKCQSLSFPYKKDRLDFLRQYWKVQ